MHKLATFHLKSMVSTRVIGLFLGMREEKIWVEKPRYSGVRVIASRVIAGSDCIQHGWFKEIR